MKKPILTMMIFSTLLFAHPKDYAKRRTIKAYRTYEKITIDGILNEKVWKNPGTDDFVMSDPVDGGNPTEKTVVWVAYDDKAIYVAARLYDSEPDKIIGRLGRRDDHLDSDWFTFAIDPYFDRRSGFLFSVNPAGSIRDAYLFNDGWVDYSWDGVWDWAVKRDGDGWTVEMRIPYSQLRFQKKKNYIWGVNFSRFIMRKQELDTFVWIPKGEGSFGEVNFRVSKFAKLIGIEGIKPRPLVEVTPYTVGDLKLSPKQEGNPFETGHSTYTNAGVDFKIGIKTNLTLTGTINPDFGQVEVDPAVINLTAYETYYEEKRPFFIEGSNIFEFGLGGSTMNININWGNPQFFYSRRIGASPHGWAYGDYIKEPDRTTILAAGKLTGKIGGGWNIGVLSALTSREYADVIYQGEREKQEIEPFTSYNVIRIQKEFNEGTQGLGFIATSVFRDLRTEPLKEILTDKALAGGIDGWLFLDKKRKWVISGWLGGSYIEGSKDVIFSIQQSPLHYFQRPDANHLHLDPEATSLSGWAGKITLNKERGNWILNISAAAISPGFEINDLGFQFRGDAIHLQAVGGYVWYHPGKVFRSKTLAIGFTQEYDFGATPLNRLVLLFAQGELLNYWGGEFMVGYLPPGYDRDLTRGGPLAKNPEGIIVSPKIFSDRRKHIVFFLGLNFVKTRAGSQEINIFSRIKWKIRSNLSISIGPEFLYNHSVAQWVTDVEDSLMSSTYGKRYVFADIIQHTISSSIRINWAFTPKLSLQAYLQPFIGSGDYYDFKELAKPKTFSFNVYGKDNNSSISFKDGIYTVDPDGSGPSPSFSFPNPDFNIKSMRGTVVLRWEYKPGSSLYLVWTQNRMAYENTGILDLGQNFIDMIKAPGDNIFLIKISFRWGN